MRRWIALCLFLILTFSVELLSGFFSSAASGSWYQELEKPDWTPPGRVFGWAWTILYFLMGLSIWFVWDKMRGKQEAEPYIYFGVQLFLNLIWSWLFFGLQSPLLALVNIVALWITLLITIVAFWSKSAPAALLLLPYWLWVTFATALNFVIWHLNHDTLLGHSL